MKNEYTQLLISLTRREYKTRYLGSVLGSYWNLVHPFVMILLYTIIFSQLMKTRLGLEQSKWAYSIYLCTGILAWNFFSEIVNRGTTTLIDNAAFLKKMKFPPYILFGALYMSAAINFLFGFAIFSVALSILHPIAWQNYLLSYLVALAFGGMGLGLGVALGCMNVFLRDFQQITSIVFQLWFWFTPIIYLYDALPVFAQNLLVYNPAFPFISALRTLLFYDKGLEYQDLMMMTFWISLTTGVAYWIYKKSVSLVRDQL